MNFSELPSRLAEVRGRVARAVERGGYAQAVTIVAVTKTHGPEAVEAAVAAGLGDVGENKVQEALRKQEAVTAKVRWHLIGHLQSNKAKALTRFALFHALDSDRLLDAVDAVGRREGAPVDVLVQVNVSGEATKGGFPVEAEALEALAGRLVKAEGLRVRGVMTMAPFEATEPELRTVFAGARSARAVLLGAGLPAHELSMGMSGDYEVAVEEGATIIRLGTVLFGARD